jgi:hypothetical protein
VLIDNNLLNDIIKIIEKHENIKFNELNQYIIKKNIEYINSDEQDVIKKNEKDFKEISTYKKYFDI